MSLPNKIVLNVEFLWKLVLSKHQQQIKINVRFESKTQFDNYPIMTGGKRVSKVQWMVTSTEDKWK